LVDSMKKFQASAVNNCNQLQPIQHKNTKTSQKYFIWWNWNISLHAKYFCNSFETAL